MIKLLNDILLCEYGGRLAVTRKTSNTLITASGFNTNYDEIEAVLNGSVDADNLAADGVTAAKLNSDVVRTNYGLKQHTDGSLYVGVDDSSIELSGGNLQVKASGITAAMLAGSITDSLLSQITTASKVSGTALTGLASIPSGAGIVPTANLPTSFSAADFVTGDLILSTVTTARSGWTNVSATYANKFMRISATPLSTGGADTHTHAAGTLAGPSHTHDAGTLAGPSHTHTGTTSQASANMAAEGSGGSATAVEHTHTFTTSAGGTGSVTGATAAGGTGSVTGNTASGDNVPSYITTTLFQKS